MTDISVVGLGNMGAALAGALLDSGRSVTVWNRSPEKAAPLNRKGAQVAPSLEAAVDASGATITCLRNHRATIDLLAPAAAHLSGKVVVDLSTGNAAEAEDLVEMLTAAGAGWMIGMINAYPEAIGAPETTILCAGPEDVWAGWGDAIRALGGASAHVGTAATEIPALFAAMFTARQGFMFGLIFGGAVCRRAGLSMDVFTEQIPVTLGMAENDAGLFARTVPARDYDGSNATVAVYLDSFQDVLSTFEATGTVSALPRLMRDLTRRAAQSGLADKDLTAIVEFLSAESAG